jgi:hypothetical protein
LAGLRRTIASHNGGNPVEPAGHPAATNRNRGKALIGAVLRRARDTYFSIIAEGMAMNRDSIDTAALARVRPGMPVAALAAIFGDDWVPLRGTQTFVMKDDIGFSARIDLRGVIGRVTFASKFPTALVIEKLHVGMALDAARVAHPSLQPVADNPAAKYGVACFMTVLSNGLELEARFKDDHILAFNLSQPGAVYELPAPTYPAPEPTAGAPFADPNFKLVVLNALWSTRGINLGDRRALANHILGPGYDEEQDGYDLLKPVYDYLVRYPLNADHLAAVEELSFDGGSEIYRYVFPFWHGEDGEFDVNSLAGIGLLPNVRRFTVVALLRDNDLARLAPLSRLEQVTLDADDFRNARALLALSRLREFHCYNRSFDPAVVAALKARGVKVLMYG